MSDTDSAEVLHKAALIVATRWGFGPDYVQGLSDSDRARMVGVSLMLGCLFNEDTGAEREWVGERPGTSLRDMVNEVEDACGLR